MNLRNRPVLQLFFVISMYQLLLSIIMFIRQCQKCSESSDVIMLHRGWDCSYVKLNIHTIHKGVHPTVTITLLPTKTTIWINGAVSKMSGHFESMPKDYLGCNGIELLSQTERKLEKSLHKQTPIIWIILNTIKMIIRDAISVAVICNNTQSVSSFSLTVPLLAELLARLVVTRFKSTLVQKQWHRNRKGIILKIWGYTQHILSLNFNNSEFRKDTEPTQATYIDFSRISQCTLRWCLCKCSNTYGATAFSFLNFHWHKIANII